MQKVEVVVASADLIPQPKTLGQRVTQPKAQPKSAAVDKHAANGAKGAAGAKGVKKQPRRGRNSRPAKKTAEELDSEMADYFESSNQNENANGAAPAATNGGDAPMEDEILVCGANMFNNCDRTNHAVVNSPPFIQQIGRIVVVWTQRFASIWT